MLPKLMFFASSDGVGFSIWRHTLKMAGTTSFHAETCGHLVSQREASSEWLCSSVP